MNINFEKLKGLASVKDIAELREGVRYLITVDGPISQHTTELLRRQFEENGIKGLVVEDSINLYIIPSKSDVEVVDRSGDPVAIYVNKEAASLATQVNQYATMPRALARIADARAYQTKDWPETATVDAGGRSTEEWLLLLQSYQAKLIQVWTESKGSTKEGLERVAKYAAIQANLALWALQAAQGAADNFTDGGYLVPPGAVGPNSKRTEAEVAATDADWADFQDYRNSGGFLVTFDGWLSAGKPRAINQNKACKK